MKKIVFFLSSLITILVYAQEPTFEWVKQIENSSSNPFVKITNDLSGNLYTTGNFEGTIDFDPGIGTMILNSGEGNQFISKSDQDGNLIWVKNIGVDLVNAIQTDDLGNVYLMGTFHGTVDFDPNEGTEIISSALYLGYNLSDGFLLKLNPNGNFEWVKHIRSEVPEPSGSYPLTQADISLIALTIDVSGNFFITGIFSGKVDFDPGPAVNNINSTHSQGGCACEDIFILKLGSGGNLIWVKILKGSFGNGGDWLWGETRSNDIQVDVQGNVYVIGNFYHTMDFNPSDQANWAITSYYTDSFSGPDIFLLKLNSDGNFEWVKRIGGYSDDQGTSMALDHSGNIYLTGYFLGIVDFNSNNIQETASDDIFILKINTAGDYVWLKQIKGDDYNTSKKIFLDQLENIYVMGTFNGTVDFDPSDQSFDITSVGSSNHFIAKLNNEGNFLWATHIGGDGLVISDFELDLYDNIYNAGFFYETEDFNPSLEVTNLSPIGDNDIFTLKLSQSLLGLEENKIGNNFAIYPNPTNDILNIELKNFQQKMTKVELVNSLGQILTSKTVSNKNNLQLNMKNFDAGVYTLRLLNENNLIETQKILKQ